jgi:hypothetical protein
MPRPHYWWNIADLKGSGFVDALTAAGPKAILRFHEDTKLFTIDPNDPDAVTTQSHEDDHWNFSHTCPPDC